MALQKNTINNAITSIETLVSLVIFGIAYYVEYATWACTKDYLVLLLCITFIWPLLLKRLDVSKIYKVNPHSYILTNYFIATICGGLALIFIIFFLKLKIDRLFLLSFIIIDFSILYLLIIILYQYFKNKRGKGLYASNVLIIGDKKIAPYVNKIERNKLWGYNIKGIVTDSPEAIEKYKNLYPIYSIDNLKNTLLSEPIDELLYCQSNLDQKLISDLVYMCLELGVTFRVTSQILDLASTKAKVYYLGETPYFTFQNTPKQSINLSIKAIFDKVFSFLVLLCLSPLLLLIAIIIKCDSKGPVFFKQVRCGLRGREFYVYKFRSMCDNAESMLDELRNENEQEGPVFKIKNDKRITRVGKFLRKTSLDELPQFINVLKGDMSVVGPRPPLPDEVNKYKPWQTRRLSMKPGITCIWQVSGRNNIPFEQWMKLDLQYIDTWSLGLDFMIIIKTIKTMLKHDGQ